MRRSSFPPHVVLLADITPLILTYNEEPNIRRTLEGLSWARQILVIDSHSTDRTLEILGEDPRVTVLQRPFDDFAAQCNFGLEHVETDWVLSLDADYICPPELEEELAALPEDSSVVGYSASFRYCIHGRPLRGSLYPPRTVLYRRDSARYVPDGHAHRVQVGGPVNQLQTRIDHDDRKPLEGWFPSQARYAMQEAEKLLGTPRSELNLKDRLRLRGWLAPALAPLYCLVLKGGLLDGRAGLSYAMQRTYAELALALQLQELRGESGREPARPSLLERTLAGIKEPVAATIRITTPDQSPRPSGG